MAVFRVERTKDYTVISNHHLRDQSLSLKAKGLLSQMLSLPDDWDYTLTGLAQINRESKDAIRAAVNELEKAGYVQRRQTTDANGKFAGNEYIIHEIPVLPEPSLDFPTTENPSTEKPLTENPTELNIDIQSKDLEENKKEESQPPKKRKSPPKADFDPLPLFVDWIGQNFGDAPRDDKNALYRELVELTTARKEYGHPIKSKSSVTAICNRLLRFSGGSIPVMIDLLSAASSSGWRTVYPPKGPAKAPPPEKSRRVEEWL